MADSYKIKKGDTLGVIAKKYNISVSELAVANNISNPNKIREGITITIPEKKKEFSQSELKKVYKANKPVYDSKDLYQGVKTSEIDNEKVVMDYMKGREPFILIDKKTNTLRRFDAQGNEVANFRVGLGRDKGDKYTINSKNKKVDRNTSPAGIYIVDERNPNKESYKHDYEDNILLLKSESGLRQAMSIHQTPRSLNKDRDAKILNTDLTDDDFSNGCINCTKEQYEQYLEVVRPGQKVIVLPEEEGNYFTIKGDKLSFTTNRDKEFGQYNFTPKNKEVTPFNLKSKKQTDYKQKYLDALAKEKNNLMKDLNLSNEEYDELAKRAYGIFGQESSFGEGSKNPLNDYRVEGIYVDLFDNMQERQDRSLGLTQIRMKHVNPEFAKKYNIDTGTLYYPYQAALATMERLADAYQAVKNPKVRDRYKDITPENVYDYAVTFYNKPETVRLGKASGKNQYVQQVKQFYSELEPVQENNQIIAKKKLGGMSKWGYKKGSPFANEPFIDIQSNELTMVGVPHDVLALPDNDKPIIMKPGKNYKFKNSSKVREIPLKQHGGNFGLAGENTMPMSPFISLKPFINKYKLKFGGVIDYMSTLPEEQQYLFAEEFDNFDEETQKEISDYLKGGYYQRGGVSEYQTGGQPNAELEDQETLVTPDGELSKIEGKKHSEGGEKVSLPGGTRIFSEFLKAPSEIVKEVLGKESKKKYSYADLSKKFPTQPSISILSDPNSDQYEKTTAELTLANNLGKLDTIFYAQEKEKEQKAGNKFKYSGIKKYQMAGMIDNPSEGFQKAPVQYYDYFSKDKGTVGYFNLSNISNRFQPTGTENVLVDPDTNSMFMRRSDGSYDYVGVQSTPRTNVTSNVTTKVPSVKQEYGKGLYSVPLTRTPTTSVNIAPTPLTFFNPVVQLEEEYVPQVPTDLQLVMPERTKNYELPKVVPTNRGTKSRPKSKLKPANPNAPVTTPQVPEQNPLVKFYPESGEDIRPELELTDQVSPIIGRSFVNEPVVPNIPTVNQVADIIVSEDDQDYVPTEKKWDWSKFGVSPELAGTVADIGLALSDRLRVSEPTFYDRTKTPLFTRFVDFDDKEVQRMYDRNIQQIQQSNIPEQVKQAQIAELTSKYQDYQAKVDYGNLQRYEAKRERDTDKLQSYLDTNIDQRVADIESYRMRKARVDQLRDAYKAQRKSRIVNSLKSYAEYADQISKANEFTPNYRINPVTGKVDYRPQQQSQLKDNILQQYQKRNQSKIDLGQGATGQIMGNVLIITDKDGKVTTQKLDTQE